MGEGCSWRVGAHAQFLDQDFSNLACALLLQLQSLASQNRMKNSSERKVEAMNLTNVQEKTNHDGADSNDLRELEDKANLKHPSNLMSLMQVYREAILNRDDKTVSDIEAKISIVEKEKNELVQKWATDHVEEGVARKQTNSVSEFLS
ncbi:GrpE protein-like protein [Forsythia ovata]|uniref:GrpE protein-like protein n=1 Tax=Forsythia ovata TaxID=205694 RepID=A0ABD1WZA9_9LAMI